MNSGIDPNLIDTDALQESANRTTDYISDEKERMLLREQKALEEQQALEQAQLEAEDPRNAPGGGGFRGGIKELQSAFSGGLQDTGSSLVTLPERAYDMFSGEMVEEQKTEEGYGAEWDDWFVDDQNPIQTTTWWGGAIRALTHFGSLAAVIIPAAKAAGVSALFGGLTGTAASLAKGAAIGASVDVVSKYSQDDNGLQILRDRYNFIDTPITTNDADHPAMKTLKNVVEGIGIGAVFDSAAILIGKGRRVIKGKGKNVEVTDGANEALDKALVREASVKEQIVEKAIQEVELKDGYQAYKNKTIGSQWQAAPTSNGKPFDVRTQLKRIDNEMGAELGSTDSLTTPVQLDRTSRFAEMATEDVKRVLKEFMSDARIQEEIAKARKAHKTLGEVWGDSLTRAQKIIEGRNTSDMTADEFWSEFNLRKEPTEGIEIWRAGDVVAADLIIGSLMKEIRDLGIVGRELQDIADLSDVGGPAQALYEKIIAGLTQVKLAKMTKSADFRNLGAGKQKQLLSVVDEQVQESIDSFRLAFQIAGASENDDLFKAIFETVSMSNDIHNITDFDAFIRAKIKGGDFKGKVQRGVFAKEMQGMMINSVLSGPKTSVRAILGTGSATFLRPLSTALGATLSGDRATQRAAMASMNAMIQTLPEAFKLFKTKLNSYWAGDISTIKSRFSEYTKGDQQWEMLRHWVENSGRATKGDIAAFNVANSARAMNDNRFLTYSTKVMAATDDTFGHLLARAKAREKAMRWAMDEMTEGSITEITPKLLKEAEAKFYGGLFDADGNISDAATIHAKKEATLTTDLSGFAAGMDQIFDKTPWAKPFFLFARTGVNGLELTAKHTPLLNLVVKEFNDIARATPDDLSGVIRYGITNPTELANAKALQNGRLAIGGGIITMANVHFMNGGLTGNGPPDRSQRQAWIDAGWKPRSIKIGDVWVSYDSLEPFNLLLSSVADVGDANKLMGEEWTENQFQRMAMIVAQGMTAKSYLAGLQQFVEVLTFQEGSQNRVIAALANNTVPLSSLRNEIGKLFNPYMKELNSGIGDAIRNRNLFFEVASTNPLPTKYDLLNGQPIRDWDFPTRMFNMISPVQFNLDQSPGRKLFFESNYDKRLSTYSAPGGIDLSDNAYVRSLFQKAIGDQNIEAELNKLARSPRVKASIAEMKRDNRGINKELNPMNAYYHNIAIRNVMERARKIAWRSIKNDPEVQRLILEQRGLDLREKQSRLETGANNILSIYK
jgi:hypothetical protein